MDSNILLVDDQRDILRLLHSTLDTLKKKEIKIFEAPSGEEALLESGRRKIDLLITTIHCGGCVDEQPRLDPPHGFVRHDDTRRCHALHDCTHCNLAWSKAEISPAAIVHAALNPRGVRGR